MYIVDIKKVYVFFKNNIFIQLEKNAKNIFFSCERVILMFDRMKT